MHKPAPGDAVLQWYCKKSQTCTGQKKKSCTRAYKKPVWRNGSPELFFGTGACLTCFAIQHIIQNPVLQEASCIGCSTFPEVAGQLDPLVHTNSFVLSLKKHKPVVGHSNHMTRGSKRRVRVVAETVFLLSPVSSIRAGEWRRQCIEKLGQGSG